MLKVIGWLLIACLSKVSFGSCGNADPVRPLDVIANEADRLLKARDFATLDKLASEYYLKESVSTDGQPKLMGFYAGLSKSNAGCRGNNESDAEWEAHRKLLLTWTAAYPKAFAPRLALAQLANSYGWKARGGGYLRQRSACFDQD